MFGRGGLLSLFRGGGPGVNNSLLDIGVNFFKLFSSGFRGPIAETYYAAAYHQEHGRDGAENDQEYLGRRASFPLGRRTIVLIRHARGDCWPRSRTRGWRRLKRRWCVGRLENDWRGRRCAYGADSKHLAAFLAANVLALQAVTQLIRGLTRRTGDLDSHGDFPGGKSTLNVRFYRLN